ncbi:filamentous hemagglutinin [Providencia alcalifaciens]|nr:filamentous hemagglutinin [Providencia alcalifaciens]
MIKSAKPLLAGGKLNMTSLTPIIEKEQRLIAANKKAIIENKDIVKLVVPKKSTYTYDEAINKVKNTGILANADNAIIDPNKITSYALNPNHPVGGDKAKVFESALGYNQSNALDLISKIQVGAKSNNAVLNSADKFGQRITIDMPITGSNGKTAVVRTGWIYDVGSSEPRLTTLYIKK